MFRLITMDVEYLREFCLTVKGAEESFPFKQKDILVFKIMGKMFAYISLKIKDEGFYVDLKCDQEEAIVLREKYEAVCPGTHGKKQWNSICISGDMPDDEICRWIIHSVEQVVDAMPKKLREAYNQIEI